jgi:hypothetical protein
MQVSSAVATLLCILPLILEAAISVSMLRRKLARQFPVFFTYTVFLPIRGIFLFFFQAGTAPYSAVYWGGKAIAILLSVGALFETISHLLRSYPFLRRLVFRSFSVIIALGIGGALVFFIVRWHLQADGLLMQLIFLERGARLLLVCLWILFTILMSRLGLTWERYPLGIAAGFAFYAAVDLALLELRIDLNWIQDNFFLLLRSAAYNLAVGIWAYYFLRTRVEVPVERLPSTDLGRWDHVLMHYVDQWYRRS